MFEVGEAVQVLESDGSKVERPFLIIEVEAHGERLMLLDYSNVDNDPGMKIFGETAAWCVPFRWN